MFSDPQQLEVADGCRSLYFGYSYQPGPSELHFVDRQPALLVWILQI